MSWIRNRVEGKGGTLFQDRETMGMGHVGVQESDINGCHNGIGKESGREGVDNINLPYSINTLADYKVYTNLMKQLQCIKCNAFYIGEMGQMFSKCINGHRSTYVIVNSDLPVPNHTKSQQLSFQECWSIYIIYKLLTPSPTKCTANLKQYSNLSFQKVFQHKHPQKLTLLSPTPITLSPLVAPASFYLSFIPQLMKATVLA